jgi:predicted nucleic-acid-binding Zn-ribbon protein
MIKKAFGIRATLPIAAFRCEQCGHVEFYARDEFKPK